MSNLEIYIIDGELKSKQHILLELTIGAFNNSECFHVSYLAKMFKHLLPYEEADTGI